MLIISKFHQQKKNGHHHFIKDKWTERRYMIFEQIRCSVTSSQWSLNFPMLTRVISSTCSLQCCQIQPIEAPVVYIAMPSSRSTAQFFYTKKLIFFPAISQQIVAHSFFCFCFYIWIIIPFKDNSPWPIILWLII